MRTFKNTRVVLLATLLAVFGLVSCSEDSPTNPGGGNNNTTDSLKKPTMGTTYTYSSQPTDGSGAPKGSASENTYTVAETNLGFMGKTGVYLFASPVDSIYLAYEANGDVSVYKTNQEDESSWMTLTVGSKKDSVLFEGTVLVQVKSVARYGGVSNITVGGKAVSSTKVDVATTLSDGTNLLTTDDIYWFAPSIGFMTRMDMTSKGTIPLLGFPTDVGVSNTLKTHTVQ